MNYIDPRFDSGCKTEIIWPGDSGDAQPEQSSPSIDWNAVFAIPEEQAIQESTRQELVARDLKVKCETPEERERLWNLIREVSRN